MVLSVITPVIGFLRRMRAFALRLLSVADSAQIAGVSRQLDRLSRMATKSAEAGAETRQRLKVLERRVADLGRRQHDLAAQLGSPTRGVVGTLRHVERNVNSLVRRQYVDQHALPFPHNVLSQRFHLWSQNEEDGITLAVFKLVGTTSRRFVELGAGVNGGNSGFLAEVCGWTGLMVDGSPARAARLAARFGRFGIHTQQAWITTESVNRLVLAHGLGGEVDLLSVDIDGNDYWVWNQLDACSPRVVIVEFNAAFGAERAVTVQYDPAFDRHAAATRQYYGASLAALARLGQQKGYRLVLVEPRGANAYFLRHDVGPGIPAAPPEAIHPDPAADPRPLFDQIARAGLPLVDLDSASTER